MQQPDFRHEALTFGEIKMKKYLASLMALLIFSVASCKETQEDKVKNIKKWYKYSTGLELPAKSTCIDMKNYSLTLAEIYCKIKVDSDYENVLISQFEKSKATLDISTPKEFKKLNCWDISGKQLTYYTKTVGDDKSGGFISEIGYDKANNVIYCKFVEFAP
jgi:hypothetical protein